MRITVLKWLISLICWLLSPAVLALTITDIDLKSFLNQPLDARIDLLHASDKELSSLKIQLHDTGQNGSQRHIKLYHEVKKGENGQHYIQVMTRDAVHEPILTFTLEANWADGHFLREYSLILDPQ